MSRTEARAVGAATTGIGVPSVDAADDAPDDAPDDAAAEGVHHAGRLDALELRSMDAELAQATLDAVTIEHAERLSRLERRFDALLARLDASPGGDGGDGAAEAGGSLAEALQRERPPHY